LLERELTSMRVASIIVFSGLLAVLNVFGQSKTQSPPSPVSAPVASPAGRDRYVGDEVCGSCHREKADSFHQTAHHLTSRVPDKSSILGKFTAEANTLKTSNPQLLFRMDEKEDGFFQTAVEGMPPFYTTERTARFGLVIGSGGKGQTYLFWKGDRLFQLPVSYWRELGWVNSPGYRDGVANFDRVIVPRCLECHATYFDVIPPAPNRYAKAGSVVGITCEKCHGAGREHVRREGSKPSRPSDSAIDSVVDSAIRNPARFSRERQMDLCAWCHAGLGVALAPTFSYVPGEPLDEYLELPRPAPNVELDVHGSQVELLEKSRCYQSSTMTCLTCHDVHTVQHDASTYSQRCLSCHKPGTGMLPKVGHEVASNCVDCHMPQQETNLIVFDWNGKKARPQVRNHWIRIYPATTPSK